MAIPKISPMIAEIIYPIKSSQIIRMEKDVIRKNLEQELDKKRRELFDKTIIEYGMDPEDFYIQRRAKTKDWDNATTQYNMNVIPLEKKYQDRINSAINRIEQDYKNKQNIQTAISVNLSRISPVSCFTYIVTELSGTGLLELKNFNERARRFQKQVKEAVYDNYVTERFASTKGG